MFFDNGGGKCYIVSVGTYARAGVDRPAMPTLSTGCRPASTRSRWRTSRRCIVIPEAVKLTPADYTTLVQAVLNAVRHAQGPVRHLRHPRRRHRRSTRPRWTTNRGFFGNNNLKYGAAYYPFLRTDHERLRRRGRVETNVDVTVGQRRPAADLVTFKARATRRSTTPSRRRCKDHFVMLPPSGAMAGVYAAVDTDRGVWKAPANVSLAAVIEPAIKFANADQDDLNVDPTAGKSINAIRAVHRQGHARLGRAHAGRQRQRVALRHRPPLLHHGRGVGQEGDHWACSSRTTPTPGSRCAGMIENFLTTQWREGALAGRQARRTPSTCGRPRQDHERRRTFSRAG